MRIFRRPRWPRGDWLAFTEALVGLWAVRIGLVFMSFDRIRRISSLLVRRLAPSPDDGTPETDAKLARAIRRAAKFVPGAKCLAQAIAAMLITARRGLRSGM